MVREESEASLGEVSGTPGSREGVKEGAVSAGARGEGRCGVCGEDGADRWGLGSSRQRERERRGVSAGVGWPRDPPGGLASWASAQLAGPSPFFCPFYFFLFLFCCLMFEFCFFLI